MIIFFKDKLLSLLLLSHSLHLQLTEHFKLALKHSQYFFKQFLLVQLHPKEQLSSFKYNFIATGFLSLTSLKDLFISISLPIIFEQLSQLQSTQYSPFAKQSQYNFKDFDFLQLHVNFFLFFLHSNFQYFCICYIKRIKVIYINIHIYVHVYFILIVIILLTEFIFFCFF